MATRIQTPVKAGMARTKRATPVLSRTPSSDELAKQHEYVEEMRGRQADLTLVVAQAFITGMRQLGYTETERAFDELIDNSIQAGASRVHVASRYENNAIREVAIIDNGHGMEPDMIPLAVSWGGSHRAFFNDRSGLGRFGFGLPTACISLCTNYTVISKRATDSKLQSVTLDLRKLANGDYRQGERTVAPAAQTFVPDKWLEAVLRDQFKTFDKGTIVLLRAIDRINWKESVFDSKLSEHFGVFYRHLLRQSRISVNNTIVEPIDPLFIMPNARYFALDGDTDRAQALDELIIPVNGPTNELLGNLTVRVSYIPPSFPMIDKKQLKGAHNARWHILKDYNEGIVITRNKRHIDVVTPKQFRTPIHRDYFWGMEIDFPATLDEAFDVGTTKHRVSISDRIWTILKNNRIPEILTALHSRGVKEREDRRDALKMNTEAAEKAVTYAATQHRFGAQPADRVEAAEASFTALVDSAVEERGITPEMAVGELEADVKIRQNALVWEDAKLGPFYRQEWVRGQLRVYLNKEHPIFKDFHSDTVAPAVLRSRLEALILIMGLAEGTAQADTTQILYREEASTWDMLLKTAIRNLDEILDAPSLRNRAEENSED